MANCIFTRWDTILKTCMPMEHTKALITLIIAGNKTRYQAEGDLELIFPGSHWIGHVR